VFCPFSFYIFRFEINRSPVSKCMVVLPQLFLFDTSCLVSVCLYFVFAGTQFLYSYYHQFVPFILCTLRVFVVVVFANEANISDITLIPAMN
jgi:hypothetical protein